MQKINNCHLLTVNLTILPISQFFPYRPCNGHPQKPPNTSVKLYPWNLLYAIMFKLWSIPGNISTAQFPQWRDTMKSPKMGSAVRSKVKILQWYQTTVKVLHWRAFPLLLRRGLWCGKRDIICKKKTAV